MPGWIWHLSQIAIQDLNSLLHYSKLMITLITFSRRSRVSLLVTFILFYFKYFEGTLRTEAFPVFQGRLDTSLAQSVCATKHVVDRGNLNKNVVLTYLPTKYR